MIARHMGYELYRALVLTLLIVTKTLWFIVNKLTLHTPIVVILQPILPAIIHT